MGKLKDLTSQTFGRWTVQHRAPNQNGQVFWHCVCSCGTERDVRAASLLNGRSTNCGCVRKETLSQLRRHDITGQKFNKLLVLEFDQEAQSWKCLCDCGNIYYVRQGSALISGHTKSCGCRVKEAAAERANDLTGQRFGKLVAIKIASYAPVKWQCQCDCGNKPIIAATSLMQGTTKSCGCLKSLGEEKIIQLLINNNIPFEYQKTFDTCIMPDTQRKAYFDFFVNNQYVIEYDGKQHFMYSNSGWNTASQFERIQYRDAYKNKWCKENNIPIIRIPYTRYSTLCLDDILLETSNFIITEEELLTMLN